MFSGSVLTLIPVMVSQKAIPPESKTQLPVQTVPQSGPERFRQNLGNSWTAYSVQCLFKLAARHAALHQGCPPLTINIFEASPTDL